MEYLREYRDIFLSLILPYQPIVVLRLEFRAHVAVLAFAACVIYAPLITGCIMIVSAYYGIVLQYDSEEFLRAVLVGVEYILGHIGVIALLSIFVVEHRRYLRIQTNLLLARTLRAAPRIRRSQNS